MIDPMDALLAELEETRVRGVLAALYPYSGGNQRPTRITVAVTAAGQVVSIPRQRTRHPAEDELVARALEAQRRRWPS